MLEQKNQGNLSCILMPKQVTGPCKKQGHQFLQAKAIGEVINGDINFIPVRSGTVKKKTFLHSMGEKTAISVYSFSH